MTGKREFDERLLVLPDISLMQSIETMTAAGQKILLVHDGSRRLLGIITDYDIRKAILNHVEFSAPVREFMKRDPVTVDNGMSDAEVLATMESRKAHFVPVIDAERTIVGLRLIEEFAHPDDRGGEAVAVIMAGGIGKRLRPMTESVPKPLLTVGGKPILFMLIDQLLTENIARVYVSLNYKSELIVNAVRGVARYRDKVDFLVEETALGTAGALKLLPARPKSPVTVINGDLLTNVSVTDMRAFHTREGNRITVALKKETYELPYGVAKIDSSQIVAMDEKPVYTHFINTGVYVLEPDVIDGIPAGGRIDMTDVIETLLRDGARVGSFPVHEYWMDIGTPAHYERAQRDYNDHFGNGDPA